MKIKLIMILVACSMVATLLAQAMASTTPTMAFPLMKDKPALTKEQRVRWRIATPGVYLAIVGLGTGVLGMSERVSALIYAAASNPHIKKFLSKREIAEWVLRATLVSAPVSVPAGYTLQKFLKKHAVARWYNVSHVIAKVCLYYNINANQYRTILTAAESRNADQLNQAINTLYPKRFGSEWRSRMKMLFSQYQADAERLIQQGSFDEKLNDDERDFVRMVELGAAMANLYYGTSPNKKNAVDVAVKLYKELGILS